MQVKSLLFPFALLLISCGQNTAPAKVTPKKPVPAGFERWEITTADNAHYFVCVPKGWKPKEYTTGSKTDSPYFYDKKGGELTVLYATNLPKDMWEYMLEPPPKDVSKPTSYWKKRHVSRNGWAGMTSEFHLKSGKFFDQDTLAILLTNKRDVLVVECKSKVGGMKATFDDLWKIVDSVEPL